MQPPYTYTKYERLCRKILIDKLFEKGNRMISRFPFRFIFVSAPIEGPFPVQVLITVSRKNFPKSTQRNRIKRQLRELYRTQKHLLYDALQNKPQRYALMISYQAKTDMEFQKLLPLFKQSIIQLAHEMAKSHPDSFSASDQDV